ncbi:Hypothetical protein Nlim_1906 [Candidatus Nitrosarchaeum limnium SFB1]|uniref:Uncharacterized protein n=1 Tax=Candidatus Nitrosarchaeum limnium SFB1 TaxID=886738 RepID=F3KNC4_9ARCH|nr:Hypothetical protein Nlim_1906 [Candidatus Nitrosarchaeum limnium SFB1]
MTLGEQIINQFKNGVGSSRRLQSFRSDWSGYYLLIPKLFCLLFLFNLVGILEYVTEYFDCIFFIVNWSVNFYLNSIFFFKC